MDNQVVEEKTEQSVTQEQEPEALTQEASSSGADVAYEKIKKDMFRYKKELAEMRSQVRERDTQEMKQREQYKELWEKTQEELEGTKTELNSFKGAIVDREKRTALERECRKLGIRNEAIPDLDYIPLNEIELQVIQSTTGDNKYNVLNAKAVAERYKTLKPHWFGGNTINNVNTNSPNVVAGTTVTIEQLNTAAKKAVSNKATSEDRSAYEKLFHQYNKQRQ